MSDGIWSALAGAVGQLSALDIAANNVANASTPGFRADHLVFREVLGRATASRGTSAPSLRTLSVGSVLADRTPGMISQTGRPLDAAIRGDGYFVIRTPRGERYSRLGSFQVARDGLLVTRDGDPVLGADRKVIRVSRDADNVRLAQDGSLQASGQTVGQLLGASFDPSVPLEKEGAVLLRSANNARPAKLPLSLETGALEQSNMSAVKGMMSVVSASRNFEACERVIDAFRDADRKAAMTIASKS